MFSPNNLVLSAAPARVPISSSTTSPHSHSSHLCDNARNTPLLNLFKDCSSSVKQLTVDKAKKSKKNTTPTTKKPNECT